MGREMEWQTLTELVTRTWRGGQYGYFWHLSADGQTKQSQWFDLKHAEFPDSAYAHCHQYIGVHPGAARRSANQRSTQATVAAINCLFADFDAKDEVLPEEYQEFLPDDASSLNATAQRQARKAAQEQAMMRDLGIYKRRALAKVMRCPFDPSWVIDTSGGYQCYWFLAQTVKVCDDNREMMDALQKEWVQLIGADPGAADLARVLRVPGSLNVKAYFAPDYPVVKVVQRDDSRLYELAQFQDLTGVDEVFTSAQSAERPHREGADPIIDAFNHSVKVGDLLREHGYQLGRSYASIERLARPGCDKAQTSVVVWLEDNRSYHHSSSDTLYTNGHSRDAFDVFTQLAHNGDASSAYIAAKKQQGLWKEAEEAFEEEGQDGEAEKDSAREQDGQPPKDEGAAKDAQGNGAHTLLNSPVHEHSHATVVQTLYPKAIAFYDAYGWLFHNGTHYEAENAEIRVNRAITATLIRRRLAAIKAGREDIVKGSVPSAQRKNAVRSMLKDLVVVARSEFDNVPHLANTLSGVVDLRSGDIIAHETSRFTWVIRAHYEPDAWNDGLFPSLMGQWFNGDFDRVEFVQRALGYTLTGDTREECLFWLNGARGRNGKGTMVNSTAKLLGAPLAQTITMKAFTARSSDPQGFLLAPLHNARMAIASEHRKTSSLDEELIKTLTGRDSIQAAFKGHTPFNYEPAFKLWVMANDPPKGDPTDDAFWSRVRVVTLPNSYLGREDKTLKGRLQSKQEQAALLSWLVLGAKKWYEHGLGDPVWVKEETERVRAEQDTVLRFAEACLARKTGTDSAFPSVYAAYEKWCEAEGLDPKPSNTLGKELHLRGYESEKKCVRIKGVVNPRNVTFLIGVEILE